MNHLRTLFIAGTFVLVFPVAALSQSTMFSSHAGLEEGRGRSLFADDRFYGETILDQAMASAEYDCTFYVDTIRGRTVTNPFVLTIGKSVRKFCSKAIQQYSENIRRFDEGMSGLEAGKKSGLCDSFYANGQTVWYMEGDVVTTCPRLVADNYIYERKIPDQEWTLLDETKMVGRHQCRKAIAVIDGMTWTAWYSEEIPFPYGPWVLGGLPGLIIEAYDSNNYYHFSLNSFGPDEGVISRANYFYIKTTPEKFLKQLNQMHENYFLYVSAHLGPTGLLGYDNPKDRAKGRDANYVPLL